MVNELVDGGDGHRLVGEDTVPGTEGLVRVDGEASGLAAPGDQFDEDGALDLVLPGGGDVVEDDQVEPVEFGEGGLETLNDVGGDDVEDTLSGFDQSLTDGRQNMGLARAGVADGIGADLAPIPGGQCRDACPRDAWPGLEVERGEGRATGQAGLLQVPLDTAGVPLGQLDVCEDARGGPPGGVARSQGAGLSGAAEAPMEETAAMIGKILDEEALAPRLATVRGVGTISSGSFAATIRDVAAFRNAQDYAAWLGLSSLAQSSGGEEWLRRISKAGNRYLRRLLYVGAMMRHRGARRSRPIANDQRRVKMSRGSIRADAGLARPQAG